MRKTIMAILLLLAASVAHAASGTIDGTTHTINLRVNFRFPPTAPQLAAFQTRMGEMSHTLWDATEGQLRIGTVTIDCGSINSDLADFWIFAQPIRSNSPLDSLSVLGAHINFFFNDIGGVYAHEFGHLGFGLGDEYEEGATSCGGKGFCIEESPDATSAQNQCLMQQSPNRDWSEFCVSGNHDPIKGNNTGCLVNPPNPDGAPCASNCAHWNTTTHKYESSAQEMIAHHSCWQSLAAKFSFLNAPVGLPNIAEPGGWSAPAFTNNCTAANTIELVLDESGSMAWNVNNDAGEVCGNGIDDDGDGTIDETSDCAQSRMEFVKAAARSILDLADDTTVRAGIVSFSSAATTLSGFVQVHANLGGLKGLVDGLGPDALTAIGSGLQLAKANFDADAAPSASKAAIIITDGVNTTGPAPDVAVPAYVAAGIRIYAISTGQASNDATLTSVSNNTRGRRVDEPEGSSLVTAIAETWSQYVNGGVVVPKTPYALNRDSKRFQSPAFVGSLSASGPQSLPAMSQLTFDVEPGTQRFAALLAGNMNIMSGFGVRAVLTPPGGGPLINSDAPPPNVRVVYDRYYTLIRIDGPAAGRWTLTVTARTTAAPVQTGNLIVISDTPVTHLYADLDRYVVTTPGQSIKATVLPSYHSGLRDVTWQASVHQPDGSVVPLAITPSIKPEYYNATIASFPFAGLYRVDISMTTNSTTTNDPGEPRPGTAPPNTVAIPPIQRTTRLFFFVTTGPWVCNEPDCDHDGITGESTTEDQDGDHIPASHDPDDNNNEIPDRHEQPDWPPTHDGAATDKRSFYFGFGVGSSHPLGTLDRVSDANIYAKLDLGRPLTPHVDARLTAGLAQFTAETAAAIPHPRYLHLSFNLQALFPLASGSRSYVELGPGVYRAKSGATSGGLNAGVGIRVPLPASSAIEAGVDFHRLAGAEVTFYTWHLGLLFR